METTAITIQVDAEAASIYNSASPEEQKKMQLLLSIRLRDLTLKTSRPLREVMDEMAVEAAANGLTPDILESILRDEAA